MLIRHQTVFGKASRSLVLAALALLALGSSSCAAALSGEQDTTVHFLVEPKSDGTFWGWTEITVNGDINSVGAANLFAVSLGLQQPSTVGDLTFLSSLTGTAVTATARTDVAHVVSFPRGQPSVTMHIDYLGDLHPLFKTSSTIRIEWTGSVNPAFTAWPAGGIWVQGNVVIDIQ